LGSTAKKAAWYSNRPLKFPKANLKIYSWVSGRSETETYGKSAVVREREESKTLPRKDFFGKDHDERPRVFNGLQVLFSLTEVLFSGKLSSTAIVGPHRASP
jgi:hypothetical protein